MILDLSYIFLTTKYTIRGLSLITSNCFQYTYFLRFYFMKYELILLLLVMLRLSLLLHFYKIRTNTIQFSNNCTNCYVSIAKMKLLE